MIAASLIALFLQAAPLDWQRQPGEDCLTYAVRVNAEGPVQNWRQVVDPRSGAMLWRLFDVPNAPAALWLEYWCDHARCDLNRTNVGEDYHPYWERYEHGCWGQTPPSASLIFRSGFESGDTGEWSE